MMIAAAHSRPGTRARLIPAEGGAVEAGLAEGLDEHGLTLVSASDPGDEVDITLAIGEARAVRSLCNRLRTGGPLLAVVDRTDRREATALLDAGASGVALRPNGPRALAYAALAVVAGFIVVPEPARHAVRRPVFTARQKQILSLLVLGMSNGDIASRLFLSESTVKTHLTIIFARLGVKSRKEASDLILDPAAGLGPGILGIVDAREVQVGYGRPQLTQPGG